MKKALFIFLLFGIAAGAAHAQVYPFQTYSIENGLSQAVVNTMYQDEEGYIWVGTGYGLNRFDGIGFRNYHQTDGLNDNNISALYEDRTGRLWIGTGGGLNILIDDSVHTPVGLEPLRNSTVLAIHQDREGVFWFATDGQGVWRFDGGGQLEQYLTDSGLGDDRVRAIGEEPDGTLWFATRGGLTRLRNGTFRNYTVRDGLPDDRLRDLLIAPDGSIWLATGGGLTRFRSGEFTTWTVDQGLVSNDVRTISFDRDDRIWAGTENGASLRDNGSFQNYTMDQGLPNNIIYASLYDREGNIWFGTFGSGISTLVGDHIYNFTVEQGLPNNVITAITQDLTGNHWISTYGGGIARYEDQRFVIRNQNQGLVDNKVYTLAVTDNNDLLIGTHWGLSAYDGIRFVNFDETDLPYRKVRAIHTAPGDSGFWLGTYGEGLLRYNGTDFTQLTRDHGLPNDIVMAIEEDEEGALWLATYGGVSRYLDGAFTNITTREGLPHNGVLDLVVAENGDLWFSTYNGITRYRDGELTNIGVEDGLPDPVCYFIVEDSGGIFWIGTKNGVVRFDSNGYEDDNTPEEKQDAFILITQAQGLIANETNAGAGYRDREGALWFGTVGGLTRFDPQLYRPNRTPPRVHIESMLVSGEPMRDLDSPRISSDNHNITFRFIGLNFSGPEQVEYEYRLRNFGDGWQRTSEREVSYSVIPAGEYEFQVRARNNYGEWSEETAELSITVLAPFWMQWWFIALVLLVIGGIIFFFYRYYRVRKMVDIERMRVRIASDLHDDVGSALTEIALQSDFLQAMEVRENLKESLHQIGSQSRKIVSSLDDIVWSIDARNDSLGDLTDRMQDYVNNVLGNKEVHYEFSGFDMDEKLPVPLKENLYLIFKEAVNNIAKHSDATRVDVKLTNENGSFDLTVQDNGTENRNGRKSGQGLRNMEMRARRIGAEIEFLNGDGFTVHVTGGGAR